MAPRALLLLPLPVLALLCGCEPAPRQPEPSPAPGGTFLSADPATGRMEAQHRDARGTTTLQSGEDIAVLLPAPFTPPPGARSSKIVRVAREDKALVMHFDYVTGETPAAVIAFYRNQARIAGITPSVDLAGGVRTLGGSDGAAGLAFVVTARAAGSGSAGQVMVTQGL